MTENIEIERKFIIAIPDIHLMAEMNGYRADKITQTYLCSPHGITHRVRKRITNGIARYTETKKVRISGMSAYEDEREISYEEYLALLCRRDPMCVDIIKTRHVFTYGEITVEIDIYPAWKTSCIMEIELDSENEEISLPPFIRVIREVTGSSAYSNASMARSFPEESV
ncbi:MAG: hypothetical protein IJX38_05225 [Clostridia bacterium]|nr:hypothetical protein [Clostridia bacterium]